MNEVVFSRKSDEWATPQDVFDKLNAEFHFTLDPCATEENHKCKKYYSLAQNGLQSSWGGQTVFCNPPYSQVAKWVEKAYTEFTEHYVTVVLLLPSRTDTRWFHKYVYGKAEIRFIKGRLKFGNAKNSAPFPSMIVVYRRGNQ